MKKAASIVLVLFILYLAAGFLLVPFVIRHFGENYLQTEFGEDSRIEAVRFNPFNWELEVEGFKVVAPDSQWSAQWALARVNLSARTVLNFYPVFDVIRLEAPELFYARSEAGGPDAPPADPESARDWRSLVAELNEADIPQIRIDLLEVSDGRGDFEDRTTPVPYRQDVDAINFTLEDFTTVLDDATDLRFAAETPNGASLSWTGRLGVRPFTSQGSVELTNLAVHQLSPYYRELLRFELERAVFALSFDYTLDLSKPEELLRIDGGAVELSDVRCIPMDSEDRIVALQSAKMEGVGFRFPEMALTVDAFRILDGETRIARGPEGEINLMNLIAVPQGGNGESRPQAAAEPDTDAERSGAFSFQLAEVEVTDYRVIWVDSLESGMATLEVGIPTARFTGLSSDWSQAVEVAATYRIGSGQAGVEGTVVPGSGELALDLDVDSVPLAFGGPYAKEFAGIDLRSGSLEFTGRLEGGGSAGLTLSGRGAVTGLEASTSVGVRGDFGWQSLQFEGLALGLAPLALELESVVLEQPQGEFTRVASGGDAAPTKAATEGTSDDGTSAPTRLPLAIASVEVRGGEFVFKDEAVEPSTDLQFSEFALTVEDLGLSDQAKTRVELSTQLNGARFELSGDVYPAELRNATNLKFRLSELTLPELSAYSAQAVGRRIANGRLSIDSEWTVADSKLEASNAISLQDFALGDRVESEAAVSLPLDLAVTLLKGPGGGIDISLPLSGDLSDPKVSIGQIVRKAFVGLITNVASAPFKLLSGLVETERDLSALDFSEGEATLSPDGMDALTALAGAMKARPALNLQVIPQITPGDARQLKRLRFEAELLRDAKNPERASFGNELEKRYRAKLAEEGRPIDEMPSTESEEGIAAMLGEFLPDVLLPDEDKERLATRRAEAVKDHLTAAHDIDPERIEVRELREVEEGAGVRFEIR